MTDHARETTIAEMATTRIHSGAKTHLYITEWRKHLGVSPKQLAERLDVDRTAVWRWERARRGVGTGRQAQIAAALGIEPEDLWRLPSANEDRASLDRMARDLPDESFAALADFVKRLTGTKG